MNMNTTRIPRSLFLLGLIGLTASVVMSNAAASPKAKAKKTKCVLVLVDRSIYKPLRRPMKTYFADIRKEHPVTFKILSEAFYSMKPPAIREILRREYKSSRVPVVGAIMVGPIPVAVIGKSPDKWLAQFYYEDFDATWSGPEAGDGIFETKQTDRTTNATEIWTAWWVPPSNKPDEQLEMLKTFLSKLHAYHAGALLGSNAILFMSDSGFDQVELGESWSCLIRGAMKSTGQEMKLYTANKGAGEHVAPADGTLFRVPDFYAALAKQRLQHFHMFAHGMPNGFYWSGGSVGAANLDLSQFDKTGANIITASGCGNGNFRGNYRLEPNFANSIANQFLFSPRTLTVAFYGSASPQSTGVFAQYVTAMFESLDPSNNSYMAEGYYKMVNSDQPWGTEHYMFRGADEKVLSGDPFARYRR